MKGGMLGARASAALAVAAACGALAVAGCGGSDAASDAAAPATTAPAATVPATTAPVAPVPVGPGRVAAGKAVFVTHCDTCHAGLGTRKYIGPKLSGQGLSAAFIRTRVVQGKSPMPAGLVSGQELADVVAFVHSIQ